MLNSIWTMMFVFVKKGCFFMRAVRGMGALARGRRHKANVNRIG